MFYFLLILFCGTGFYGLTRLKFVRRTEISFPELAFYFIIRIVSAFVIGWVTLNFYPGGNDYWGLNEQGINEHHFLVNDPIGFFKDLFHSNYGDYSGMFGAVGTYWNDLKNILLGKLLGVTNFLSGGNYYLNAILWNCLGFLGSIGFYRGWIFLHPSRKWPAKIAAYLIPSTIFFSSGIHKDLMIFSMLGIYFYCMTRIAHAVAQWRHWVVFIFSLLMIFLVRNYLAVVLFPLSVIYITACRFQLSPGKFYAAILTCVTVILLALPLAGPKFSIFRIIAERQQDFAELPPAGSDIKKAVLGANVSAFAHQFPDAFKDGFLRPFIWETPLSLLVFTLEWMVVLAIYLYALFIWLKHKYASDPNLILFSLLICCTMFLLTGYIVNNLGAIVRYRSIYLPLLTYPALLALSRMNHIKFNNMFIF